MSLEDDGREHSQFGDAVHIPAGYVHVPADVSGDLLRACEAWLSWRKSPEGPDVLFEQGTKAYKDTFAAVAKAKYWGVK